MGERSRSEFISLYMYGLSTDLLTPVSVFHVDDAMSFATRRCRCNGVDVALSAVPLNVECVKFKLNARELTPLNSGGLGLEVG